MTREFRANFPIGHCQSCWQSRPEKCARISRLTIASGLYTLWQSRPEKCARISRLTIASKV